MSCTGFESLERRTLFSFAPPVQFPLGAGPVALASGDFNGDGKLDLVTANIDATGMTIDGVSVLLGKPGAARQSGDATFEPTANYSVGNGNDGPSSVAVGDFNGDGKLDIVTAYRASGTLSVLLGDGKGSFQPPITVHLFAGSEPAWVAVGDFNGDGRPDLAVADAANGRISILLGNASRQGAAGQIGAGQGGADLFAQPVNYSTGAFSQPTSIAVGDFNGDGKLDLVVGVNYSGVNSGNLSRDEVFMGRGDGTFSPPISYMVGSSISHLAVGRFHSDGKLDLVNADPVDNDVRVLAGNGDGTFEPPLSYATGAFPVSVAVGDFNGDGKLDIATANQKASSLSVLAGKGDGTFEAHVDYPISSPPRGVAAGDFAGNGLDDLATANAAFLAPGETQHVSLFVSQRPSDKPFVDSVYGQLLHRPVDAAGLAFWSNALASGASRGAVVLAIEASPEYFAELVQQLYGDYLHRAADRAGLSYFVRVLQQGGTAEQVAASLAASPEAMGISGAGNGDFVNYVYATAVGRAPDVATLQSLNGLLVSGASRAQVAADVLARTQYQTKLVNDLYRQFLGRAADPQGLRFQSGLLAAGVRDEQVIASVLATSEFVGRLAL